MTIVLNNDIENGFEATEFSFDYLKNECAIRNHDIDAWSEHTAPYVQSLKNTSITSIQVIHNDNTIRTYSNLSGKIVSFQEVFQLYELGPMISFELSIRFD